MGGEQLLRLMARVDELQEEVHQLRAMLGLEAERERLARLQVAFELSPSQAAYLHALHRAAGRPLPLERISMAAPPIDRVAGREPQTVRVQLAYVRARLGAGSIQNVRGGGYFLAEDARRKCDRALEAH